MLRLLLSPETCSSSYQPQGQAGAASYPSGALKELTELQGLDLRGNKAAGFGDLSSNPLVQDIGYGVSQGDGEVVSYSIIPNSKQVPRLESQTRVGSCPCPPGTPPLLEETDKGTENTI